MIFIYYKDFKILIIAQFGALAGQIQHMAAQKVRFTPRPIRYEPLNLHVSSSSPAALEYTYQIISYHIISYHIIYISAHATQNMHVLIRHLF
jgi:hypothetical protein